MITVRMTGPSAGGKRWLGLWAPSPAVSVVKRAVPFLWEAVGALTVGGSATINIDGEAGSAGGTTMAAVAAAVPVASGGFFSQTSVTVDLWL